MQRGAGDERLYRVPYGDGELEFMLQPWFDLDARAAQGATYDIVIVGIGKPDDTDLASALRKASAARSFVREGGALIVPAQLEEGEGDADEAAAVVDRLSAHMLVIVAASESPEIVRVATLRAAVDAEEALDIAYEHIGRPARASVLLLSRAG